jgi:hypothetical protein
MNNKVIMLTEREMKAMYKILGVVAEDRFYPDGFDRMCARRVLRKIRNGPAKHDILVSLGLAEA